MIYKIAVCDHNLERKRVLVEMLHVFSNEYGRKLNIQEYTEEGEFIKDLDQVFYHVIFLNILQAGNPMELDCVQDIHIKNMGTLLLSLCPKERYIYYKDLAQEFASLKEPIQYSNLKSELMRAIKYIDSKENPKELEDKYIKIRLKRKYDYVEIERITYVECTEFGTIIHTLDRDYYCFECCREIFDKLRKRPNQFVGTDDNYMINFNLLYDMEKIEVTKRRWGKEKHRFYAVMTGYAHVPVKEGNYDILFRRFVNEIIRRKKNSQNLSKISMENM